MTRPVLVVAETDHGRLTPPTLECVEEARDVVAGRGGRVHAILPGSGVADLADDLAAHGADRVTVVEHDALAQFSADGWVAALEPVLRAARPLLIIAPDSAYGRAWLPRLSVRWRMPLATNCSRAKVIEDGFVFENEFRSPSEVMREPAEGFAIENPAYDATPMRLVEDVITDED